MTKSDRFLHPNSLSFLLFKPLSEFQVRKSIRSILYIEGEKLIDLSFVSPQNMRSWSHVLAALDLQPPFRDSTRDGIMPSFIPTFGLSSCVNPISSLYVTLHVKFAQVLFNIFFLLA